ncbi:SUKH-3 domain-containing protein [Streptomyces sp. BPTC-684]|uniref:SUKH-3 domain-containing protein n=1 Tax=Streptomyces sp. BPTC-684 TaxID=3043734 RepID=UPI0024B04F40|nr:SUKH-3 domain-containing protein [Streptomyces sp. BPTC-684]WHM40853.1 SUKH-3 domain-containing protein [Streptomyces sp. BPTC-684]
MSRFSPEVEGVLRAAGWFPGRRVDIEPWRKSMRGFSLHAAAEEFLREFGGIRVRISGPGITCAREPFVIDPDLAYGEEEKFAYLSEQFGRAFFPVGEHGNGEFYLAIDAEGVLYLLMSGVQLLGPSDLGLDHLIVGVAAERLSPADPETDAG